MYEFPEHGNSLIMRNTVPIGDSWRKIAYANVVLYLETDPIFRLRVGKCRLLSVTDTAFYQFLKDEFPSMEVIDGSIYVFGNNVDRQFIIFTDDTEAVHFKLKYC